MAFFQNVSVYKFENPGDTGINRVPQGSLIYIEDYGSDSPMLIAVVDSTGLSDTDTLQVFLNDSWRYKIISVDPITMIHGEIININEGGKDGFAIRSEDRSRHLDIGQGAIDLSISDGATGIGASGDYSFAVGKNVKVINESGIALGKNNAGNPDNVLEVGWSDDPNNPQNVFEIKENGVINAPFSEVSIMNSGGEKVIVTKEFLESGDYMANAGNF